MLKLVIVFVLGSALAVPLFEPDDKDDGRIIGGTDAAVGQYPHQVSLRSNANEHFCGGSIISPNWILTAAHCVYQQSAGSMLVVVGTNYRHSGGVPHRLSRVIMHESYNPQSLLNDIAVLQVSTPIQYTQVVQPINLATSVIQAGVPCTLSGWGAINFPQPNYPNSLQHISLTSITVEQCRQGILPGTEVHNSNVCTREPSGRGACKGDSGGPLICGGVQHGVVSWGDPCAKGRPDVFSSVAYYRNWIKSRTGV